ncbi:putative Ribonuclease P protein subunit rpr2 [Cardiosporidium cionae]|uniref:Ribonuclease P protein subunit rpr2 n=1 Tax=Cardiosporidium cionae TaxID=476202 RepID=A0ABQ7J773_9APIC|nr:putative Ribonuclease P protein subunit rpr2 [Cardiosporidium cionae]|eukprot:KAF8819838.1 putative Ribonuclease P protein subunit rpr2 [Cardiosporidium cionae]
MATNAAEEKGTYALPVEKNRCNKKKQIFNEAPPRTGVLPQINFLLQAAGKTALINPNTSRFFVKTAREIARKHVIRLDPSVNQHFCKGCNTFRLPGKTCIYHTISPSQRNGFNFPYSPHKRQRTLKSPLYSFQDSLQNDLSKAPNCTNSDHKKDGENSSFFIDEPPDSQEDDPSVATLICCCTVCGRTGRISATASSLLGPI